MNIDEKKLKEDLRSAVIDCCYIAQVIINDLPDIDRIELLEMAVRGMLTYCLGAIFLENNADYSLLKKELQQSLIEFREHVEIADYDSEQFVNDILDEVLGEQWK